MKIKVHRKNPFVTTFQQKTSVLPNFSAQAAGIYIFGNKTPQIIITIITQFSFLSFSSSFLIYLFSF